MALLDGLKNRSPSANDSSTKPPSGSVNDRTTRSSPAASPKSLGPRTAR